MLETPKLAWATAVLAFIFAGFFAAGAILGPVIALPFALVPLLSGIGIIRRKFWSAYGFAVYLLAQLVPVLMRLRDSSAPPELLSTIATSVVISALFVAAGRSLQRVGASSGPVIPWVAAALFVSVPYFFIRPFVIPTGAMEDTILIGDRIFVRTFPAPELNRGDIVTFIYPVDRKQNFVKRIIGIEGDRIRISNKVLFRNGVAVKEPYAVHKTSYVDPYRDNFPDEPPQGIYPEAVDMFQRNVKNGELIVPAGKYFLLGDNRDYSLDSRYWGFVDASDMIGKPFLIYDSAEAASGDLLEKPNTFFQPRKTRWGRILKPL